MHSIARSVLRSMSPGGKRGRVNIFIFHRVLTALDVMRPGEPDEATFDKQLDCIGRLWNVLPLGEALERLATNSLPARAAVLTFDDGYADNIILAGPLLQRHGLPATVFIASGFLNGGRMWNDTVIEAARRLPNGSLDLTDIDLGRYELGGARQRYDAAVKIISRIKYADADRRRQVTDRLESMVDGLPDDLMLSEAMMAGAGALGIQFGAHTVDHPILARLSEADARREIAQGKADVEAITGAPVDLFAYPNGKLNEDYLPRDVGLVKQAGFRAAVATNWGVASASDDVFQLPRYTPWRKDCPRFTLQMLQHYLRRG